MGSGAHGPADLVSVVICVRNRATQLVSTLESVVENHPHEIIVIDDQSTDGTGDVARRYTPRVIRSQGNGLAAARQQGVEAARCPYIAFVDSDVVLSPNCLGVLLNAIESDSTVAAVSAKSVPAGPHSYWPEVGRELRAMYGSEPTRDVVRLRACLMRREALLAIPFDPFFVGAAEDMDLSRRLAAAGWRLTHADTNAYHHHPLTLWRLFVQHVWYGRGGVRLRIRVAQRSGQRRRRTAINPFGAGLLWRLLREGRVAMAVYVAVTKLGIRIGMMLERIALRRTLPEKENARASFS